MILIVKRKIMSIAEVLHLRIFGHEMSDEMRKFLGHLSWSFFGGIIASGILFVVNILAGRWLGPVEYGKYGLVIAISSIFIIPMTIGIDNASIYYIAKSESEEEKKKYLSSSFFLFLILICLSSLIFLLFNTFLAKIFNTDFDILKITLIFSIFLAIRTILDSYIKGFHFFKFQSLGKILESITVVISFILLFCLFNLVRFESYILSLLISYTVIILTYLLKFRNYFYINISHAKKILLYGSFASLGSLSGIMLNSFDKILINKYIGQEQLGIYNAYFTSSFLLVSQLTALFINVFFPFLSSLKEKNMVLKKINKLSGIFLIPALVVLCAIIWISITFFGYKYDKNIFLIIEFGIFGITTLYVAITSWLIASLGKEGVKFVAFNGLIVGFLFIILMVTFKSMASLYLTTGFLIVSSIYIIFINNIYFKKLLKKIYVNKNT